MKLVMTLLVRDEQDILRENIEFHLSRGVDEIILMDNRSTDATADIAAEYVRAKVLHYSFQPDDDYAQGRWVTGMARQAAEELGADWVINNDADEFWWPEDGSLKDVLAAVAPGSLAVSAARTNFVPRPPAPQPFWRRMDVRERVSRNALGGPLPGKVAHRASADVVVGQGNHTVSRDDEPIAAAPAGITILHFPLRSQAQFINKIALGGGAYARNAEIGPKVGGTWRRLHQLYRAGGLDEEYARHVLDDDVIERGLSDGSLVRDERLKAALCALLPA